MGAAYDEFVDRSVLHKRDEGICGICGEPVKLIKKGRMRATIDHIIPLSRGGLHSYANVQIAHWLCNVAKGNKLPDEMAA